MKTMTRVGDERGQVVPAALVIVLAVILVAGGVVDLYRLQDARSWAYRAAEAAAIVGTARGRDLSTVYTAGVPRVDPATARAAAIESLTEAMAVRGVTGYNYEVVVWEWGGTEAGFPPVERADLWGETDWWVEEAGVGVYVEVPVETFLLGLATGHDPVYVHAAAAAAVASP